ncbi:Vivapain-2 [Plasmodium coatneyi]|uniref:Vivapain-2 n=1 Tax=Plasmodium coatneyi TaxID=208452 RepID=A0A1B1DZX8_9APIC|nr:Vivapain-2 [Plasmodium coatneyi]ANQ08334.1 Vivapain-2 [Plasmodium coatneyi]
MEYQMEYASNESAKSEKEAFVQNSYNQASGKGRRRLLYVLSVAAICLVAGGAFYYTRPEKTNDDNNNDDVIINTLLKSPGGKKFIVSKLTELVASYDREDNQQEQKPSTELTTFEDRSEKGEEYFRKRFGNLKNGKRIDINFADSRFLMTNLENVNAFYLFIKEHGKKYNTPEEMQQRYLAFAENLAKINAHNSKKNVLYKKGMNHFGDLSFEEFKKKYLTLKTLDFKSGGVKSAGEVSYEDVINKYKPKDATFDPAKYDWRLHRGVSPVKDQGDCGSCWAFSTVGVVESQYLIRKNELVSISEQQMVDCSTKNNGCHGGLISLSFEDMIEMGGLCSSEAYPYVADVPEMCKYNTCDRKYKINNFLEIPEFKFKEAVRYLGPISVSVAVSDDFAFYQGGIFDGECGPTTNHAVILVGFGAEEVYDTDTNTTKTHYYYIIKNSWGTSWGERGFIRMETDINGYRKPCLRCADRYNTQDPINTEKKAFLGQGYMDKTILKKKKNSLILLSVSVICIFVCSAFYFTRSSRSDGGIDYDITDKVDDDYIINFLLKSKNGKKFIASKVQELISTYDKEKDNSSSQHGGIFKRFAKRDKCTGNNCSVSPYRKNAAETEITPEAYLVNPFIDTKFLMTNLENVNAFYLFIKEHGKKYNTPEEMQQRYLAFAENLAKINAHNSKANVLYKKRMNHFGDLSFEEFKKKYLTLKTLDFKSGGMKSSRMVSYDDIIHKYKPKDGTFDYVEHDWRQLNAVTPVKDQQNCGACWAFSTVSVIESQYAIRKKELISLSEQEMVDCSFQNNGCDGGFIPRAFEDMIEMGGLCKEKEYPYVDLIPELCYIDRCQKKYKVTTYVEVPQVRFKEAIKFLGPISVSIHANDDFAYYDGGLFDGSCGIAANHAVVLVGYGMEEMYDAMSRAYEKRYYYWLRNSWGEKWGEKGYMKIQTDEYGLLKTCDLGEQAYYSNDNSHKPEKELFVEKSFGGRNGKGRKSLLAVLSVSVICLLAGSVFYYTRMGKGNDVPLYGNTHDETSSDDFIISTLLRSPSGKKFIVSKLQELIASYDEGINSGRAKEEPTGAHSTSVATVSTPKQGNLKMPRKININFADTKFLMTNLENVNAFYLFIKEHGKKYNTPEEMQQRYLAFAENLAKINAHNSKANVLYKKGTHQYSDITFEEFKKTMLTLRFDLTKKIANSPHVSNYNDVLKKYKPADAVVDNEKYDWREHNAVSKIKNQSLCGSCWAFGAVGAVESQYAIRKNQHILISEQELVDCSDKNFGCYGGLASSAYDDVIDLGYLCSESEYPYVGFKPRTCEIKKCKEKYTIKSYVQIPEDKYKEAIQFLGPLTLGLTVDDNFYDYQEGIFTSDSIDEPNHEVMIVGYGVQEIFNSEINANEKHYYYIIKNSWGTSWGEKGFMRIETDELGLKKINNMTDAYVPLLD